MTAQVFELTGGEANAHQTISIQLGDYFLDMQLNYQQNGQWLFYLLPNGDNGELPTFTIDDTDYVAMGFLEPGMDMIAPYNLQSYIGQLFLYGDEPTLDNLGVNNKLVWIPADEILTYA